MPRLNTLKKPSRVFTWTERKMGQAISEETVGMADKLYGARRAAKMMLGDRYGEITHHYKEVIRTIMRDSPNKDLTPLLLATRMAAEPHREASERLVILAAAVDLIEAPASTSTPST